MISALLFALIPCGFLIALVLIQTGFSKDPFLRNGPADIDIVMIIHFVFYYIQTILALVVGINPAQLSSRFYVGETALSTAESSYIYMGACWLGGFVAFVFFRLLFNRIFSKKSPIYLISSATPLRRRNNSRAGLFVVLLVVGAIAVVELSVVATGGFSALLDMTSARLAKADDSFVLLVGLLFLIPALVSIFAFELKLRNFWLVWLVVLIVAGLGGGRGATFVLFFIAILRLILINYRKISITWLFAGMIPATFAMYLYTNIVRFRGSDGGGDSGIFDFLLNSETFAAWKSLAAVIELDFRMPYPGYSLFSAVFYPLPRAIVPFKPDPPSSLFTMQISPTRFANTNSEITISGMGDMIANFGLIAGPIVFGFLLAFLASFACRLRSNGAGPGTAIYVALIIFTMTFFRADIFGASRILWFLALIVILQRSLGGLLTLLRRR